jgi:integrase
MRFADVVESFITLKASEWKVNSREPEHYRRLKTGALGRLWAHEIDQTAVETELQSRWGDALANADKYRIRIMLVINHAVAKEARADGPNPARKEIIGHLIPSAPKSTPRPAMNRNDVPAFMAELVADGSPAARALAFTILTVARNSEARLADWSEIVGNDWIIPGGREERSMKEGQEHAVPLSPAALALLGKRKASGLIFGEMHRSALNDKLGALREGVTVHGFRTSFTSWAKSAGHPKDLRELAKAHAAGTATEAAYERYDRDDQLKALRPMLQAWAEFAMSEVR